MIINAKSITVCYEPNQPIINAADLQVGGEDFVFITGKSGSGKSTLIRALCGELNIYSGELSVCLTNMRGISSSKLAKLRQKIGIIFQDFCLIDEWSVEQNVMLPLIIKGYSNTICKRQVAKLLGHVSLLHKSDRKPCELSGGEQQRVAMARALAHNPQLLLCDEPTGNLDEYSSDVIWSLLKSAKESLGTAIVVVTHKLPSNLRASFRHIELENGKLFESY